MFSAIVIPYIIIFHTWYHESNIICFTVKWLKVFRDMKISKCRLRNVFILTECLIWLDDFIRIEPNCFSITIFRESEYLMFVVLTERFVVTSFEDFRSHGFVKLLQPSCCITHFYSYLSFLFFEFVMSFGISMLFFTYNDRNCKLRQKNAIFDVYKLSFSQL